MKYTTTKQVIQHHFQHPFGKHRAEYIHGYLTGSINHIYEVLATKHPSEDELRSLEYTLADLYVRVRQLQAVVVHQRVTSEEQI